MNRFIVVDLAMRSASTVPMVEALRPDFTVCFYCELLGDQCRVKECLFGRWTDSETGKNIFWWNFDKHNNCPVFLEGLNAPAVAEFMRRTGPAVKVDVQEIPIDRSPNAKFTRMKLLLTEIQAGHIRVDLTPGSAAFNLLSAQLRAFPRQFEGHDDFRDALSLVPVVLQNPASPVSSTAVNPEPPSWAGDPVGRSRWEEEHKQEPDDGYGSFSY